MASTASIDASASVIRSAASNCSAVAPATRSTGLRTDAPDEAISRNAPLSRGVELGHLQTRARARVGRQDSGTAGIADDGDPASRGEWLMRQHHGGRQQLVEGVDADHARLPEQRVDRDVGRGERRGVRRRRATPGRGTPALDRDDRLRAGQVAREAGELARVPERLEIQEDHLGLAVVGPVLQQVVAADVGLVAHRDELRDPDAELTGAAHQLDPEPARLRQERDVPRDGPRRRERRVHSHVGRGVHHAETVRSDDAHAVAARQRDELALGLFALGTGLGEPGRDDQHAPNALLRALPRDAGNVGRRHDDDREVDGVRHLEHARVRAHAGDGNRRRVYRVDRALEPVLEQVAKQLVTDPSRAAAGSDHRDRAGREQPSDRRRLRVALARLNHAY